MTAAERIRKAIADAREGGYPQAPLFYVDVADVEKVLRANERMKRRIARITNQPEVAR